MSSLLSPRDDHGLLSPTSPQSPSFTKGTNPLSSKVTTVLSSSYADAEFRESLALLDVRRVHSTPETRRQLRLDLQKEVIESNGEIINEFAKVAQVRSSASNSQSFMTYGNPATVTHRCDNRQTQ